MRPKSIILLVLALGCGLISAVGINQVIASRETAPVPAGATEAIFVALAEINMNDLITPAMVKLEAWPKDKIPPGALSKLEDLDNRRALTKLFPGEPLLNGKLMPKGASAGGVGVSIPKGFRVVAVRVDDVASTGSMLLPGDRVDVLVHIPQNSVRSVNESMTRTFLHDVKVFAVNDQARRSEADGESKLSARTVSLLVRPDQAELLTLADSLGKIRLVMRNPEDQEQPPLDEGTSVRELLGVLENTNRAEENPVSQEKPQNPLLAALATAAAQAATATPPSEPAETAFVMTIIRGSSVEEVVLDEGSKVARQRGGKPASAEAAPAQGNALSPAAEDDLAGQDKPPRSAASEPLEAESDELEADD